ncbi:hypothetical protein BN1708_020638, partial [Verticillium longisporum]
GQEQRSL